MLPLCLLASGCDEKNSHPLGGPPAGSPAETTKPLVPPDAVTDSVESGQTKQVSPRSGSMKVSGAFQFASNPDEGTFLIFCPAAASCAGNAGLPPDGIVIRNVDDISRIMKIPKPQSDAGDMYYCNYYDGQASITIENLKQEMLFVYDEGEEKERTVGTLVSMESKEIKSKNCMDLEGELFEHETYGKGLSSAEEAARLIGVDNAEHGEHDPTLGVYNVGISTTVWLPEPGAHVFVSSCFIGHKGNCVEIYRLVNGKAELSKILGCENDRLCVGFSLGGWKEGRLYILEEKTGDKWFFKNGAFRKDDRT